MRYKEIANTSVLDLDEGWKDNLKKAAMTGGIALGLGTAGADIASHMTDKANASVNPQFTTNYSQDFMNRMDRDRYAQQAKKDGVHQNYPKELLGKEGEELKKTFVDKVTPLVRAENDKIMKERNHISKLISKMSSGKDLTKEEHEWMEGMHQKYKMDTWNPRELLKRVDVIPMAIAVSQSALESGWGTSRFAKEANALFGQKTTSKNSIDSQSDKYAKFEHFQDSIESYMRNLNTNKAYDEFRKEREYQRKKEGKFDNKALISTLLKYSTRGKDYVKHVRQIMADNDLDKLS